MKPSKSKHFVKRRPQYNLSADDRAWFKLTIRSILAEVIASEAQHGGYDGATEVTDDEWSEEAKRKRIGFAIPKKPR